MPILCVRCARNPVAPGRKTCQPCLDDLKRKRQLREARMTTAQRLALREKDRKREHLRNTVDNTKKVASNRRARHRERLMAVAAYGGRCVCCGETEPLFLTLDHANNDGAEHRLELLGRSAGGAPFYAKLRHQGYPTDLGLQVLCMNCHWAKDWFGQCPHQTAGSPAPPAVPLAMR